MSVDSESEYEYIGHTHSGKRYRVADSSSSEEESSDNTKQQIQNTRKDTQKISSIILILLKNQLGLSIIL